MNLSIIKICLVLLLLIGFLVAIRWLGKRYAWHPEWQRKALHVGLGLTSLVLPWVFIHTWEVLVVGAVAITILLAVRNVPQLRYSVGKSLYDVKRSSLGELLFALSIIFLFWASQGNLVLYIIPMTILTFSDAVAAIVGTFYGKHVFYVIGGTKSWEGTLTFFIVTGLALAILLYALTDLSLLALICVATTFAILGALIEAISWYGLDNFFIPIGSFLFLNTFLNQGEFQLFYQLIVLIGFVALGLVSSSISQLNTHALIAVVVFSYFFWVVGGIEWFVAPLIVLICHMILVKIHKDQGYYTIEAVISITSSGFIWLLVNEVFSVSYGFFLYTISLTIHLLTMVLLRLKAYRGKGAEPIIVLLASLFSASPILATYFLFYGINNKVLILCGYAILVMFAGGVTLRLYMKSDRFSTERWVAQGLLSFVGSSSVLVPIWIMGAF